MPIIVDVLETEHANKLIMDQDTMVEMLQAELRTSAAPSPSASSRISSSDRCKERGTIDLLDNLRRLR
jgi:hypothetical protein